MFNALSTRISDLLDQAAAQADLMDVETHQPDIDDDIADIYDQWGSGSAECAD